MPTDTTQMTYNSTKHLYVLDIEYLKTELGLDFVEVTGSQTKAKDKAFQISRTIYNFIYTHTHYRDYVEYRLALDDTLRADIQSVLEEQARYEYEMSVQYLAYQSGINLLNGTVIPLERLRGEVRISPDAHDLLRSKKLLFTGQYTRVPMSYDYTEMGY